MQAETLDKMTLDIEQTLEIKAQPVEVFEALVWGMTDRLKDANGNPLHLKLEPWPGGRWFRDLGEGKGHLWGIVQSIKPPVLLELFGPMFMSCPVSGHIIVRLAPTENGTKLTFRNQALGLIPEAYLEGVEEEWMKMLEDVKERAQG
jgi:uncharacterized protein YndB with AHSA1/START domain